MNIYLGKDNEVKRPGTTVDNGLKFETRISNICTKSKQQLSVLSRVRNILNFEQRTEIFKSFFKSPFKYRSLIWMLCSKKNLIR